MLNTNILSCSGGRRALFLAIYCWSDAKIIFGYREAAILLLVLGLIYAIFFCIRNFNAEKHNEIANNNKTIAFSTFREFVDATGNEEIKDQILFYAATAIFANTATGYSKDRGVPLPPTLEVARQGIHQAMKAGG